MAKLGILLAVLAVAGGGVAYKYYGCGDCCPAAGSNVIAPSEAIASSTADGSTAPGIATPAAAPVASPAGVPAECVPGARGCEKVCPAAAKASCAEKKACCPEQKACCPEKKPVVDPGTAN